LNSLLRNMMSQMESWEAAAEFGIPETEWAKYDVRQRSDSFYIACLASIFDVLRLENKGEQDADLAALAKTLIIYSQSAASPYLKGIERKLNQTYSAALYYLAGFPATAKLLSRNLTNMEEASTEEVFLLEFFKNSTNGSELLRRVLSSALQNDAQGFSSVIDYFQKQVSLALEDDPRRFIAAKLAHFCVKRFAEFNVWNALRQNAANYSLELWKSFLNNGKTFSLWEFLPSQLVAIRAGILGDSDDTFSLQMPTSAGKTALCELLIYHEIKARNRRVLFLVPFRALAAEIREGMSRRLEDVGIRVITSHGGNIPTRSETTTIESADVLIVTPEKFVALTQIVPNFENQFKTIICDEGHLIDDNSRGLQYELLLTKLRGTQMEPRKIVFISAILPNVDAIHAWLGGKKEHLAYSAYKPVETDYAFLTLQLSKDTWQLDVNPHQTHPRSFYLLQFLEKEDFRYINKITRNAKLIDGWKSNLSLACAAALKARRNGSVALFTTTRGGQGIQGLSEKLLQFLELNVNVTHNAPSLSIKLPILTEFVEFIFGPTYSLSRLVRYGVGFHHGMLPQEVRRVMEEALHEKVIDILLCTTTLAEGVNLPIRTLVVHTTKYYNGSSQSWEYLQNRTIKNIIGRAGRAGKETRGRVLFIAGSERASIINVLRERGMEAAYGALFRLIRAIKDYTKRNEIVLENEILEKQKPWFLSLIDSIDFALLDLIPSGIRQEDINRHVEELLERTLAKQFCDTPDKWECLKTLFFLRADHLQRSVTPETWPILRKSGTTPRFWQFLTNSKILDNPLWQTLSHSLDDKWLNEIILTLRTNPVLETRMPPEILLVIIRGWMSGLTYAELSATCGYDVDQILEFLTKDIGYHLQDYVAKMCQLAINRYDEMGISEVASNWSSLLQFGLGTMQQLDLFEWGCSERLAVWGVSRYLIAKQIPLRDDDLIIYLRQHSQEVKDTLNKDNRVPEMSARRLIHELNLN